MRWFWSIVMAFAVARPALAEPVAVTDRTAAEALFVDGRSLVVAGRYAEACAKFEASQRLERALGTMLNLADCYEKLGRTASAWVVFRETAAAARSEGSHDREEFARKRAAALEPKLSTLTIRARGALSVLRDGSPVDPATFGSAIPIDPGNHLLEASAPGKQSWSRTITIHAERQRLEVVVPDLPPSPSVGTTRPHAAPIPSLTAALPAGESSAASTTSSRRPTAVSSSLASGSQGGEPSVRSLKQPETTASSVVSSGAVPLLAGESPSSHGRAQRIAALGAGLVGVTGLGIMTYFGLRASSLWDDARRNCPLSVNDCDDEARSVGRDAASAGNIATVGLLVGAVGLVGGAALWWTAPRAEPRRGAEAATMAPSVKAFVGPSAVVIRGAF